jgi:hypothetical protein
MHRCRRRSLVIILRLLRLPVTRLLVV